MKAITSRDFRVGDQVSWELYRRRVRGRVKAIDPSFGTQGLMAQSRNCLLVQRPGETVNYLVLPDGDDVRLIKRAEKLP